MTASLILSSCSLVNNLYSYSDTYVYYVRQGDSLSEISTDFGVSIDRLSRVNGISNPNRLAVGQRIVIPINPDTYIGKTQTRSKSPSARAMLKLPVQEEAQSHLNKLRWPVRRRTVNSKFGWRKRKFHEGIDLKGRKGDPIYAAHSGRVVYQGRRLRGYGNLIAVKGSGILTIYAHNSRNRVSIGDRVTAGERIGDIGATGHATGPHLHFEVRIPNEEQKYVAVDPMKFLQ